MTVGTGQNIRGSMTGKELALKLGVCWSWEGSDRWHGNCGDWSQLPWKNHVPPGTVHFVALEKSTLTNLALGQ